MLFFYSSSRWVKYWNHCTASLYYIYKTEYIYMMMKPNILGFEFGRILTTSWCWFSWHRRRVLVVRRCKCNAWKTLVYVHSKHCTQLKVSDRWKNVRWLTRRSRLADCIAWEDRSIGIRSFKKATWTGRSIGSTFVSDWALALACATYSRLLDLLSATHQAISISWFVRSDLIYYRALGDWMDQRARDMINIIN